MFLSKEEILQVEASIASAELLTSGEIRVHIDKKCRENVLDSAAHRFAVLKMHRTKLRNGVLIYIAYEDRKFAVIGDVGINTKVPENFWNDVCQMLQDNFRNGKFCSGICNAVMLCGEKLKEYFPVQENDENELSNEVTFGA